MSRYLLILLIPLAIAIVLASGAAPVVAHSPVTEPSAPAEPFPEWLEQFRADARARGISRVTIEDALSDVEPIPRVIELDRRQPEFSLTFREYLSQVAFRRSYRQGQE